MRKAVIGLNVMTQRHTGSKLLRPRQIAQLTGVLAWNLEKPIFATSLHSNSGYSNEANATTPATANFTVTEPEVNAAEGTVPLSYAFSQAVAGETIPFTTQTGIIDVSSALPQ